MSHYFKVCRFKVIVSISVLQGERSEMLGKLLGRRSALFDFDLSSVAKKSEGFVANDLQALTARALHARALRDVSSDDDVTESQKIYHIFPGIYQHLRGRQRA